MSDSLVGQVAVVTGSGRGIGAAIARKLGSLGVKTVVNFRSSADDANAVVEQIVAAGGQAIAVQADVGVEADVVRLFHAAADAFGTVTLLVNNAARRGDPLPAYRIDMTSYQAMFDANVKGPLRCMVELAQRLGERPGRIVNLTSGQARTPMPQAALCAATKGAMESLTRAFAADLGQRGITVNALAPGATASDTFSKEVPEAVQQRTIESTALGRLGTPEDIADVAALLLSDDAHWITGQIIEADGGLRR